MGEIYVSAERIKTAKHIFNHGLHIIDFWITLDFFFFWGFRKNGKEVKTLQDTGIMRAILHSYPIVSLNSKTLIL